VLKVKTALLAIFALISISGAQAQDKEQWDLQGGWRVRYNASSDHWWLYHTDRAWKSTISVVWADRRQDVSMAQAFEETKTQRAKIDDCPALLTTETKPEYEPFAAAMLALTKIKDPEAYDAMDKDIPIIGYEAVDDMAKPHCALIAREFSGGAMLYALVKDDTDRLSTKLGTVRRAVHALMDDIHEREAPTDSEARPVQTATENDRFAQCQGAQLYHDAWVLSWSPERATVYVHKPEYMDAAMLAGKKARLGFTVGGKMDAMNGREEHYYSVTIAAEENGSAIIPEKRALRVDGHVVQEWSQGGGQWASLTDQAMQALFSGETAVMETGELGRIRFQLARLNALFKLADIAQQKAVIKTRLGECEW